MARVELDAVSKRFGAQTVLQDVSLTFEEGEFIVLVGPSGCGKSTLLRMIAGLETVSNGEIRIDGARVNEKPPRDRDIAMVFQSYALYPHMNVARNMGFSLEIRGESGTGARQRIADTASTLGLQALLERLPKALSGGQRQRVAMGRAIVRDPRAFLFDEPLSNLDAALRVEMRLEIARLHQRLGTTMIYVTHDQVEAMTLADRIVVLDRGVVQQVGSPMSLYENPANLFVAGFIGSPTMNLLATTADADALIIGSDQRLPPVSGTRWQKAATLGIRPEHISAVSPQQGQLQGTVGVIERLGADAFVYAEVPGAGRVLLRSRGNTALRPGEHIGLSLDLEHAHCFDSEGRTLSGTGPT